MKYCLDTSVIIKLFRGEPRITSKIKEAEENHDVCTTIISIYELYKGVYAAKNKEIHLQRLKDFLNSVEVFPLTKEACEEAGIIFGGLRKENLIVEDADLLISAIALRNKAVVVTTNPAHFSRITVLKVENWIG